VKKIVLVLILLGGVGAGTYYWKNGQAEGADESAVILAKVERGPIKQIVGCTGKVVSNLDVEIKCKASGTVIELPYDISDEVEQGQLLVRLDPVDMKRNLEQATVSLDASKARLATAQENLRIAERTLWTDRQRAEASLKAAEVAAEDARAKADRVKQLFEKKLASEEERDSAETAATQAMVNLQTARIKLEELKTQEQALEVARQNVTMAETQVRADEIAVKVAQDRLSDCVVLAPMNGVVTDRKVQTGMIIASGVSNVGGGTSILTLSDLSRIFVLASVDESDIGKVDVGQPAVISVDAYPSMQFLGKVVRIASKGLNTQNVVTFEVKIEVLGALKTRVPTTMPSGEVGGAREGRPGREGREGREGRPGRQGRAGREGRDGREGRGGPQSRRAQEDSPALDATDKLLAMGELIPEMKRLLKPEMTANVEITTAERSNALLVRVEAISRQAGQMFANVPGATEDAPEKKPVELGITDGIYYEVLAGLNEGDTVVIRRGETDSRWANSGPGRNMRGGAGAMRMMRMGSRGGR